MSSNLHSENLKFQEDQPGLSVVIPVRNEKALLRELYLRLRNSLPDDTQIIFVDDGSNDGSQKEMAQIVSEDSNVLALRFQRRSGKSHALAAGFACCQGKLIATIDADLQEDPADILRLIGSLRQTDDLNTEPSISSASSNSASNNESYDLVTGWRRHRKDRYTKVIGSKIFNTIARILSGVPLWDINCGLKVMRREVVDELQLEGGYHRFIPLLAHWKGFEVGEVEVKHAPRLHGRSRFGRERILHGLVDLLVLLFLERFERRPSRLFLSLGALFFFVGFCISLYITALKMFSEDHTIQNRYPLLILGVLLLVLGVQIISTGLLAELVAHRYHGSPQKRQRVLDVEAMLVDSSKKNSDSDNDNDKDSDSDSDNQPQTDMAALQSENKARPNPGLFS